MPDLHRSLANFRAALDDIRRAYPAEDDAEALTTTALGETTLEDDILRALREVQQEEDDVEAINIADKARHERMMMRSLRKMAKIERLRAACLNAMQEVGLDKKPLRGPDMSVSIGLSPAKVIITDQYSLPPRYKRQPPPEPNKTAIAEALKRGETVPGAELGNRAPFLRISTK